VLISSRLELTRRLLESTPASWIAGVQAVRLAGGAYLAMWIAGEARGVFSVEAGSLDLIVGALALPLALWLASGSPRARVAAAAWNVLGNADFAIAVPAAILTGSGPAYMLSMTSPFMDGFAPLVVLITAFGVPLAIVLHVFSLW
jgi:hypothetical protein